MEQDSHKNPTKRYIDLEPIGRGGMGELFRAHDQKTGKTVAIKIIRPDKAKHETCTQRFDREARALSELSHPNIVTFYDYYEQQNVLYFTMEYIEGRSLRQIISNEKLSISRVLTWFIQLADALATAHSKGIIHRDIKPANIMISSSGNPILVDFGLAKKSAVTDLSKVTQTGQIVGTLVYMPPEVVTGGPHDESGDVYQLAFSLYLALTREYPLTLATLAAHVGGLYKIIPPSTYRRGIDEQLEELLLDCLSAQRKKRPQSAEAFKNELVSYQKALRNQNKSPFRRSKKKRRVPNLSGMGRTIALLFVGTMFICLFWLAPMARHYSDDHNPKLKTAIVKKERQRKIHRTKERKIPTRTFRPSPLIFAKAESASPKVEKPPPKIETGKKEYTHGQTAFSVGNYELAFLQYRVAAKKGHVEAKFSLGVCYENGLGTELSASSAVQAYQDAAKQGNVKAQARLAHFYYEGIGVAKNLTTANNWLRMAAASGHTECQYKLAQRYVEDQKTGASEQAFHWFQRAAQAGHKPAMFYLSLCFEEGKGTKQNGQRAYEWMKKAADAGFPPAQRKLGISMHTPAQEPTDGIEVHINKMPVDSNDTEDKEVEDETEMALRQVREAMEQLDHSRILANLKIAVRHMNPQALHTMGQCYDAGLGMKQDNRQARQWYKKAATRGYAPAQLALAEIYLQGKGVRPDLVTAERWLYKAVNQDHIPAMLRLAGILEHGKGVFYQDRLKALALYKKAAAKGSAQAAKEVGRCYRRGVGVSSDRQEAQRWFNKAQNLLEE